MYGVSKITNAENIMLVCFTESELSFMTEVLNALAKQGVVVDMISQTAPSGREIRFSFTASYDYFETTLKTIALFKKEEKSSPMISGGYTKINLFSEDMVESVGVAARALTALHQEKIETMMITTSDLDISLLVRREESDIALTILSRIFEI